MQVCSIYCLMKENPLAIYSLLVKLFYKLFFLKNKLVIFSVVETDAKCRLFHSKYRCYAQWWYFTHEQTANEKVDATDLFFQRNHHQSLTLCICTSYHLPNVIRLYNCLLRFSVLLLIAIIGHCSSCVICRILAFVV